MSEEHQRYERLAVGHVVGGLDEVDAARFRSHLVTCRDCRTRVAELRGIASDLLATEREERAARGSGRTELAERVEEEAEAPPRPADVAPVRAWPWRVVAIGLLPLVLLGALAWGVWLRAEAALTGAALETANTALRVIAEGEPLALDVTTGYSGLTGVVVATGDRVVVDLSTLPEPRLNEVVRAVLLDGDGEVVRRGTPYSSSDLRQAWMFDVLDRRGTDASSVAIELVPLDADGSVADDLPIERLATATLPTAEE
jgi:hypothetical protein